MDLKALSKPFNESEIEWRIGQCGDTNGKIWGFCLAYIQARAVMDRLDEVCGQENWKVSYENVASGTFCTLSIKIENEWVSKQDGSDPSELEAFKGAVSGSLKRAGSVWGIGRYLYGLDSNMFIQVVEKNTPGSQYGKTKDGTAFQWLPPKLPNWALPMVKSSKPEPEKVNSSPDPVKENKPAPIKPLGHSRAALIAKVMEAKEKLQCTNDDLAVWSHEIFNKPTKGLNDEELSKLLDILMSELGRKGVVMS